VRTEEMASSLPVLEDEDLCFKVLLPTRSQGKPKPNVQTQPLPDSLIFPQLVPPPTNAQSSYYVPGVIEEPKDVQRYLGR